MVNRAKKSFMKQLDLVDLVMKQRRLLLSMLALLSNPQYLAIEELSTMLMHESSALEDSGSENTGDNFVVDRGEEYKLFRKVIKSSMRKVFSGNGNLDRRISMIHD